jgi:hypothetical protein
MHSTKYGEIDEGLAAGQKALALLRKINKDLRTERHTFMALLAECSAHFSRLGPNATNSTMALMTKINEAIAYSERGPMTAVQKSKHGCGNPHHYADD